MFECLLFHTLLCLFSMNTIIIFTFMLFLCLIPNYFTEFALCIYMLECINLDYVPIIDIFVYYLQEGCLFLPTLIIEVA